MNIFAKIIVVTASDFTPESIDRLGLNLKEKTLFGYVYTAQNEEGNIVFIVTQKQFFSQVILYVQENYEVVKFFSLGNAHSLGDVDLELGDVMVPNTLINEKNEVLFLDYIVDKNYDLKKFGLLLNGICYTREKPFQDEEELLALQSDYVADILDDEAYILAELLSKNELLEKSCFIKVIGNESQGVQNGVDILELML